MSDIEIVRATVRGVPNMVVMQPSEGDYWLSQRLIENRRAHTPEEVTDLVPLRVVDESEFVVIDPNDTGQVDSLWASSYLNWRKKLLKMLKPVEPPIPPKPEGDDWVALDKNRLWWDPQEIKDWDELWKAHGPLTIYRKEGP
jgi:hypothetical protein